MVKKFFCFLSLALLSWADPLDDAVENLLGSEAYQLNQNFIHRLFKKKEGFYQDDQTLNYYAITKVLKDNGLLILNLAQPTDFSLGFKSKTKPIFLIRTINSVLSSIGYSYFTISRAKYYKDEIYLVFSLATERIVDPVIVLDELKKRGFIVDGVVREQSERWFYEVRLDQPIMTNATRLSSGDRLELKNISGEYWFELSNTGSLSIVKRNSKIGWSPRIVLYDKDLQILEIITQNDFAVSADVNIPPQTAFVMVTDLNNPSRLKNGITVTFN